MPFKDVWSVRVKSPGDFKDNPNFADKKKGKFRTKKLSSSVSIVFGKLKKSPKGQEGSGVTQAYRLKISRFKTLKQVKAYLKTRKIKYLSIEAPATDEELLITAKMRRIETFRDALLDVMLKCNAEKDN